MDSSKDGWHGGYVKIQGIKYCENLKTGHEEEKEITITGKYIVILDWISGDFYYCKERITLELAHIPYNSSFRYLNKQLI